MKTWALQLAFAAILLAGGAAAWWMLAGEGPVDNGGAGGGMAGGQPPAPVEVRPTRTGTVEERVEAVGTTRADESVEVVSEISGRVSAIRFEEGQQIEEGETLIELESSGERANLREAEAQLSHIDKQVARARQLLSSNSVTEARMDELQALRDAAAARVALVQSRLRDRVVRAPFGGIVGLREISVGAYVSPQQRITTLDDLSVLRLEFAVPERFLGGLERGLAVIARSAAFADGAFEGEVIHVDTRVDPATRTVRVQAEIPNDLGLLRPGMFMTAELILSRREAVLVAEEAIVSQGPQHSVYVVEDGQAARRTVELGVRMRGEVELRTGVEAGEPVVVLGLQRMRDGAPVRILEASAPEAGAGS